MRLVDWQVKKRILKEDERELYEYAYELVVNQCVNVLLAVLIAICLKAPLTVFLFLLSYIPLRSFCGGYHAETNEKCTIMSAFLIVCVCLAVKGTQKLMSPMAVMLCFMIAGAVILSLAPVEDHNKPLDEKEEMHYRKSSRIIWLIEMIVGISMLAFGKREAAVTIAFSHIVLGIMLCLGARKNKRLKPD